MFSDVAASFGERPLFENVTFELHPGDQVALIGRNGSGKTTLLRLAAGLLSPDRGSVHTVGRVVYLAQHAQIEANSLLEAVTPAELALARAELARAEAALSDPSPEHLEAYAAAEERFRLAGGWDFEPRAREVLAGLGLEAEHPASGLSGGQQRRVMLARLLLSPADTYLLDEPTNHLDWASLEWLERWIREQSATFLIVSHDRSFLDATAQRVLELERGSLHEYPGNYSAAMALRRTLRAAQQRDYQAFARKAAALEAEARAAGSAARSAGQFNHRRAGNQSLLLAKNKAESVSNTLARKARALEKRLERMREDAPEKPFEDMLRLHVPLGEVPHGPNDVLRLENLGVARGGRTLLRGLNLSVRRGDRLALLGENGSGKSSLLSVLLGHTPAAEGEVRRGVGLELYWAGQHGEELLNLTTLEDALRSANPALARHDLYALLAALDLPRDPQLEIARLSGGQRTRLSLARLGITRAHLLVLDEPTNHLDPEAIDTLEAFLADYPGTVIFASHDRRLVQRVATRRLWLESGEWRLEE
nr:ABC-F family ATP-binding cassette domain-containing protein [Deinobacterium chartae]